jgi:hypothetical protein
MISLQRRRPLQWWHKAAADGVGQALRRGSKTVAVQCGVPGRVLKVVFQDCLAVVRRARRDTGPAHPALDCNSNLDLTCQQQEGEADDRLHFGFVPARASLVPPAA